MFENYLTELLSGLADIAELNKVVLFHWERRNLLVVCDASMDTSLQVRILSTLPLPHPNPYDVSWKKSGESMKKLLNDPVVWRIFREKIGRKIRDIILEDEFNQLESASEMPTVVDGLKVEFLSEFKFVVKRVNPSGATAITSARLIGPGSLIQKLNPSDEENRARLRNAQLMMEKKELHESFLTIAIEHYDHYPHEDTLFEVHRHVEAIQSSIRAICGFLHFRALFEE